MLFLEAVFVLFVLLILYFFAVPALYRVFTKKSVGENVGEVEKTVNSAIDTKSKAEEEVKEAKKKAAELLEKAKDLHNKL